MSRSASTRARSKNVGKRLWLLSITAIIVVVSATVIVLSAVGSAWATQTSTTETTKTTGLIGELAATPTTIPEVTTTESTVPVGPVVEYSADELEFIQLLNDYRVSEGLEPLLLSDTLTLACDLHTADMVTYDFLNHFTGYYRASSGRDLPLKGTRSEYFSTGANPAERMIACGYDYETIMGENLAAGQPTAAEALKSFQDSPTHDANLLSDEFKVIGIALVYKSGSDWGHYWTTDFGGHVDDTAHAVATAVANAD